MDLVTPKSRVAPLKKHTPRLELIRALTGARLANILSVSLKMEQTCGLTVLCWICCSAQRLKPFVGDGVIEIQTLNPASLSHISGKINPADIPTMEQKVTALMQNQLWWNGPSVPHQLIRHNRLGMETFQIK